jgi:sugar phosphate isomerase/epimerase
MDSKYFQNFAIGGITMTKFPISIASYSFHNMQSEGRLDVFGYLELLASRYHVGYADIWSGFLPVLEESFLLKIREEMDRRGLSLANLCVDGPHLWEEDPGQRENHNELALKYIEAGKILGARTIRIDMGCQKDELSDEAFEYIVEHYRKYAQICYDQGMLIGPENHWGASRRPCNLKRVLEAVNHPGYGHLLHFENFKEDRELGYETVIPIAMHTHIAANTIPAAKDMIRRLAAAGYKGTYSVEHHSAHQELERVEWQLASVRCIIRELEEEGLDSPTIPDYFQSIYFPDK